MFRAGNYFVAVFGAWNLIFQFVNVVRLQLMILRFPRSFYTDFYSCAL